MSAFCLPGYTPPVAAPRLRQRSLASFASLILFLTVSARGNAQAFADLQAEVLYIDNLTRSEHARDAREDSAAMLKAKGGVHLQPGDYTGLTLGGTVTRTQFRRHAGLSNFEVGLDAVVTHKFGLGERRPVLSAGFGIARNEYNLGIRDAWIHRADLMLRRRVTERLSFNGGLQYEKRDGDHDVRRTTLAIPRSGAAWDIAAWSVLINAELDLDEATWASAGYRFQDGDVVSTAMSYLKILNSATAITLDPQFGPSRVAYRIPARTHVLTLDVNRAVLQAGTIYFGFEYQDTHGVNGIDYTAGLLRSGFLYSF
jgi:hypothetical protein